MSNPAISGRPSVERHPSPIKGSLTKSTTIRLAEMKPLPPRTVLRKALFKHQFNQLKSKGGQATSLLLDVSGEELRKHFDEWDKDKSGSIDRTEFKAAVEKLGLSHTIAELEEMFQDSDTDKNGKIDFEEFRRAVNTPCAVERWARSIPFARLLTIFITPSQSEKERTNPLGSLIELAQQPPEAIDRVFNEIMPFLKSMASELLTKLKKSVEASSENKRINSKFDFLHLKSGSTVGTIKNFMDGLEGRVGLPNADLAKGMEDEHCNMPNSDTEFTSSNYNIKTTARQEWNVVCKGYVPENFSEEYRKVSKMHHRKVSKLKDLMKLKIVQADSKGENGLSEAEVKAIVLYTGPNYMLYNAVLRRPEGDEIYEGLQGNTYPNTIHALVSAVLKLQRKTALPEGLVLYRGLGRALLPPEFYAALKATGIKGLTEFGFMSTTMQKHVATDYSKVKDGNPVATVLAMQCGAVDRAARLTEFSQFPGEEEWLWTPMSYVEPEPDDKQEIEMTPHGVVRIIPVRVNTNLKAKTVEEIVGQRKAMLMSTITFHKRDLERELQDMLTSDSKADNSKLARMDKADRGTIEDVIKYIHDSFSQVADRHRDREVEWYNEDHNYRAAINEILDIKSQAVLTFEYFLDPSSSQTTTMVRSTTVRGNERKFRKHLERRMLDCATPAVERKDLAIKLCKFEGLTFASDGTSLVRFCDVAATGNPWHIELLLHAEAFTVDCAGPDGYTALMAAAEFGHVACIETLLQAKADPDWRHKDGRTALYQAAKEGHRSCLALLHQHGQRCNAFFSHKGKHNALSVASFNGFSDCVKLLNDGNDRHAPLTPSEIDSPGCIHLPALCWAIRQRHIATIQVLTRAKCSVNMMIAAPDFKNATPLTLALGKWWGDCPRDVSQTNKRLQVVNTLLEASADPNLKGKSPTMSKLAPDSTLTALMLACIHASEECVHKLLQYGASVHEQDNLGNTALHYAAHHGASSCVEVLLRHCTEAHREEGMLTKGIEFAFLQTKNKKGQYPHTLAKDQTLRQRLSCLWEAEQQWETEHQLQQDQARNEH